MKRLSFGFLGLAPVPPDRGFFLLIKPPAKQNLALQTLVQVVRRLNLFHIRHIATGQPQKIATVQVPIRSVPNIVQRLIHSTNVGRFSTYIAYGADFPSTPRPPAKSLPTTAAMRVCSLDRMLLRSLRSLCSRRRYVPANPQNPPAHSALCSLRSLRSLP